MQLLKFLSVSSAAFLVATAKPVHKRAENNRCQAVNAGSLARQLQELKSAGNPGLVPLNIPSFEPETVVSLYYNGLRVPYGKDLDPLTDTALAPEVYFPRPEGDASDVTYTLIYNDPDAPSPLGAPTFQIGR